MRFCTHCGAQVPDNSKFCTACGTPIDAPDEATVVISDPEEEVVEASDVEGEFTAASWSPEPAAQPQPQPQQPQPQPQPQPQARPAAQPVTQPVVQQPAAAPEKQKGFFHHLWLYIKIIALVVLLVLAAVAVKGFFSGKNNRGGETLPQDYIEREMSQPSSRAASRASAPSSSQTSAPAWDLDDEGFGNIADMSESDREEYLNYLLGSDNEASASSESAMVQVGPVRFLLAGDYKIDSREHMQNAEACIIVPKNATNRNNRLKVVIIAGEPEDNTGFTSEEIGTILKSNLADLVEELTDGKYNVHYDDNASGTYFPHCYTYLNLKNSKTGKLSYTYTESTFVSGSVLTGCAVATDEDELAALMDIYSAVVAGAIL